MSSCQAPPAPFIADGCARLAYELHVTNILPMPVKVTRGDLLDGVSRLAG